MAMRQVEIQARSVDEAVRLALEQMGRTRDQVDVEVLSGSETGSEDDEVLVRVTAREQLSGAREREMRAARETSAVPAASAVEVPREPLYEPAPPPRAPRGPRSERPDRGDRGDRGERFGRGRGERHERGPRSDHGERPVPSEPLPPGHVELDPALEAGNAESQNFESPADAVAPTAAEILQQLLSGMRFDAHIARHNEEGEAAVNAGGDEPAVVLNITGLSEPDEHQLIGRRGEHLAALQFMVNLLLGARTDLWARVVIDVDGYRIKRKQALTLLAERMADRVVEQGQPYPLEPMSPYDRRIVHMALSEHPQVMTESTGEGEERRVVIMLRQDR